MAEDITLPASAGGKIVDTFIRTSGGNEVHMQSVVPVEPTTGVALNGISVITETPVSALNGDLFSIDASGFKAILLQLIGTWVGTVTFQGSNDNTTWYSVSALNINSTGHAATSTAVGLFLVPVNCKYMRARVTAYTSGTVDAVAFLSGNPGLINSFVNQTVTLAAGTSLAGDVSPGVRATATNAASRLRIMSAATTNATSVKASAGRVYGFKFTNTSAALKYVKLYNKASAPTVGTDVPVETIAVPAGAFIEHVNPFGVSYATGIALAITGAAADADTTAVAANDIIGDLIYA